MFYQRKQYVLITTLLLLFASLAPVLAQDVDIGGNKCVTNSLSISDKVSILEAKEVNNELVESINKEIIESVEDSTDTEVEATEETDDTQISNNLNEEQTIPNTETESITNNLVNEKNPCESLITDQISEEGVPVEEDSASEIILENQQPEVPEVIEVPEVPELIEKNNLKIKCETPIPIILTDDLVTLSTCVQGGKNIVLEIFSNHQLVGKIDHNAVTYSIEFQPSNVYVMITGIPGAKFDIQFTFNDTKNETNELLPEHNSVIEDKTTEQISETEDPQEEQEQMPADTQTDSSEGQENLSPFTEEPQEDLTENSDISEPKEKEDSLKTEDICNIETEEDLLNTSEQYLNPSEKPADNTEITDVSENTLIPEEDQESSDVSKVPQ